MHLYHQNGIYRNGMKFLSFMILTSFILTACGRVTPAVATRLPTNTPVPLSPSPTQPPSVTPTLLPSLTPTPGVSPLLPILKADCFNDYPAPIKRPDADAKSYQVRSWNVESAFGLIRTIDENSPPCNENWFGSLSIYLAQNSRRESAQLAVNEAILRYPDTSDRYLLDWRKAVNDALLNSSSSDVWLLSQLLQALNEGRATPETLANFVQLYSFEMLQWETAANGFADGSTGYVYWLSTHAGGSDGLYIVIRENQDKTYNLYPLVGFWMLTGSVGGGFSIEDHTKDGVPEIAVYKAFRNGSFCWDELNVFQWNEDRFEDLTIQGIESGIEGCQTDFGEPDAEGFDTINMIDSSPGAGYRDVYEWNGRFYERADRIPPSFQIEYDWELYSRIEIFTEEGKFPEAKELLNQAIAGIQNIDISPDLEYNFLDYLRFQLGWVQALQMDVAGAKESFGSLAEFPTEPTNTIVSQAAQDFLSNYASEKDLYRACSAANRRISQKTDLPICSLPTALLYLSKRWTAEPSNDLLTILEEYGVGIASSLRADVDGDGMQDWILSVKTLAPDLVDIYVIRTAESDFSLVYLTDSSPGPFQLSTVNLPNSERPTVFLQAGQSSYLFQVVPGKYQLNAYFIQTFHDVKSLELSNGLQEPFEFKITYFPDEFTPDWETYHWDRVFQQFTMVQDHKSLMQTQYDGPIEAARQAEAKLLIEGNPLEAIPLLKAVLAMPKGQGEDTCWRHCVDRSRLRYLLALSYELTGDNEQALEAFWKLWHDDPDSAYAVMARAKLESIP